MGGHFMFNDDQETPNTLLSTFEYPHKNPAKKKMLVFEVRHWYANDEAGMGAEGGNAVGNIFLGSDGIMVIPSYSSYKVYYFDKKRKRIPGESRSAGGDHFANFIDAVRKRDHQVLNADIEEGHVSSALCHLANVSYRMGSTIHFDADAEKCRNDNEANRLLTRNYRAPFVVPNVMAKTAWV